MEKGRRILTYLGGAVLLVTILLYTYTSYSQEPTLTPAPSKTPTPASTTQNNTTATPQRSINIPLEPLTQKDLSVLTGNVQRPNGFGWHNNKLYSACNGDWTLYEIDDTTGATTTYIYGVRNAHTLFIEEISSNEINLWIPDFDTNSLLRVNRNRAPERVTGDLRGPWGIISLDGNNFLVTNLLGNSLTKVNRNGTTQEIINNLRSPTGITADENYIYIANNGSARRSIEWLERQSIIEQTSDDILIPKPLVSGLQSTTGLALGPDGYLYFAYSLGTRGIVGRVDPELCRDNGGCTNEQIEIVIYTDLASPLAGLTISPDMRLFVHTIFRPEIYWVQLDIRSRG